MTFIDQNCTVIEMMLSLINEYGLSHVCGSPEFVDIGKATSIVVDGDFTFNFPYLDILLKNNEWIEGPTGQCMPILGYMRYMDPSFELEFYLRGTRTEKLKFGNLYEYLLAMSFNGLGLIQSKKYEINKRLLTKFQFPNIL